MDQEEVLTPVAPIRAHPVPAPASNRERVAREGAPSNILVNGVRLGYIASGFHQRWHKKTKQDMAKRANMVPLKRGGDPDEAAALMIYLLSGWANFITGQMLPLTGGDWL